MEALTRLAMIGTGRFAEPSGSGGGGGELASALEGHPTAELVAAATIDDRERRLLTAAGALAVYQTCGRRPHAGTAPPAPAPADQGPVATPRAADLLREAAMGGDKKLLVEWFEQLAHAELRLPHEFLPTALDTADEELRPLLRPLLGERGRWLAQFRKEWNWVESSPLEGAPDSAAWERAWNDGSLDERRAALRHWRRTAPEESRRRLAEVWKTEKAETRGELLEVFTENLSADDEPMLEGALDDRSSGVRQMAAGLLARLPNSKLSGRMIARADAMLVGKTSGLLRRTFTLTAEPPQEIDAAWERDGIATKAPAGVGKRAFWLKTVLAAVRPAHWSEKFRSEPAALLAAIAKDDFADAVIDGWTRATIRFDRRDPASDTWVAPLAEYWSERIGDARHEAGGGSLAQLRSLLQVMPAGDAEALVERLIGSAAQFQAIVAHLLPLVASPWTRPFARRMLETARRNLQNRDDDRAMVWSAVLTIAADALPAEMLTVELESWDLHDGDSWQRRSAATAVERFCDRVRLRRSFREAVAATTKS